LSKRLGTLSLRDLRAQGLEPMAILSHMARLGSSDPIELRTSMDELIDGFDLSKFGSAPTKFDLEDLRPLTAKYIGTLPYESVADLLAKTGVPAEIAPAFWEAVRGNLETRADVADWWALCRDGADPLIAPEDAEFVATAKELLPARPWNTDSWKEWTTAVKQVTGRKGRGLFMPLRKALSGRDHGPDMSHLMPLLQNHRL
jgi:glutamyl-tRNA synthetase